MDQSEYQMGKLKQALPMKTSSEIIKEAKESLPSHSVMNTKIVKTKRPFTPRNNQRILFEQRISERPTSSISFQNIETEKTETKDCSKLENYNLKTLKRSRTKLPSLVDHKSMTTLEKLPEEFLEIVPEQREVYSSPALDQSTIIEKNGHVWFPLVADCFHTQHDRKLILFNENYTISKQEAKFDPDVNHSKPETSFNWLDTEKSIQDNEINEAKMMLKSKQKNSVQSVIAAINKALLKGYEDEEMIELLKILHTVLENEKQIRYSNDQHLVKNLILKSVFSLIDSPNETLLLYVVQIILLLRVMHNNLATVCKLIFKISRFDKNDELFLERKIIGSFVDCLGLATPDDDSEALIYGYGALKFLMMNFDILQMALDNGILQLMALHLKMINLAKTEGSNFPEQTSHVLFQLTSCLRNVANDESTRSEFVTSGTLPAVCKTIKLFISDIDLVVNVARIMSILSTNEDCCNTVADDDVLHTLLKICKRYPGREDIIVRVMYAIGNVLAVSSRARLQLYTSSEGTLETILNLLHFYLETDLKLSLENTLNMSHQQSVEDIFIKIIRVVANMCLDESVGVIMVSSVDSYEKINEFLDCLLILLRRKTIYEHEELIISILSTLNNLSYYALPDRKNPFDVRSLDICEALNSCISTRHEECILEVGHVYGNLSRSIAVRKYLLETGSLNYVIDWLDSVNKDLLLITTGVFVNMMVDEGARQFLKCTKGIEKLIDNLRNHAEKNWHLGNLICQVIWNFCVDEKDLFSVLGEPQAQSLMNILIDLLDEDKLFSGSNVDKTTTEYKLWEEFSVVATNLLERMECRN